MDLHLNWKNGYQLDAQNNSAASWNLKELEDYDGSSYEDIIPEDDPFWDGIDLLYIK
jgi:hypothetical protein